MHTAPINPLTAKLVNHMNMYLEENRLESFKKWVFDDDQPCNAAKMAECGFYFVGNSDEPDAVQCFLCNKMLDGWESNDDPWKEHYKHSMTCEFAKMNQPQSALTIVQLVDFKILQTENYLKKVTDDMKSEFNNTMERLDEVCDLLIK